MKTLAVVGVLAAAVTASGPFQEPRVEPVDRTRFLFSAILEGLTEDGFDPALAGEIADRPQAWFVKSCPVCDAVHLAFRAYKASCDHWPYKGAAWAGSRVAGATADALRASDTAARHKAFEALVSRYVDARFDRMKITEAARDRMRESLRIGMKEGLAKLKESGEDALFPASCPSCEGAN